MFITIDPPPGVMRTGTKYKSKGRFYDANLWRWFGGASRPVGGWTVHSQSAVSGKPRGIIGWRDNSGSAWAGVGTHTGLYYMTRSGVVNDITPLNFTIGRADSVLGAGYGAGAYGASTYGTARTSSYNILEASTWSLDTWGQDLIACMVDDGLIYEWSPLAIDATKEATGTAQAGGSTSITLASGASSTDNDYNNLYVIITGGTGVSGEARLITAYNGTSKVATVNTAWTTTPDSTTTYALKLIGPVANAPTARSVVVTAEKMLMALGAGGDPRAIANSDLQNNTVWTETVTNYARHAVLQTTGKIICGRKVNGGTLIWTDVDVWLASFLGQPFVYGYTQAGKDCGVVSQNAISVTSDRVFWMGVNGFWVYNGFAQPLPSDVQDYVFSDINLIQAAKIFSVHNSQFGEVWWFYVSGSGSEIDRYVAYNYRENHWTIGSLTRLSGIDRGAFSTPLWVGDDGYVYDHETGLTHGGVNPYATTGPFELGQGDNLFSVEQIVPDEKALGQITVSFNAQLYPLRDGYTYGPYTLTDLTDARFTGRQVQITYQGIDGQDFRVGAFRFDGRMRGKR